jgi:1-phosphofructokinase
MRGHVDGAEAAYPTVEEIPMPAPLEPDAVAVCVFAPVPLLTITIEQLGDSEPEVHLHAGGQGVWIARMATILGARGTLCTILGGETGKVFESVLEPEIELRKIESGHATAAYVHDRRHGERMEIVHTRRAALGRHEQDELHNTAMAEALAAGICVLAGTQDTDALEPDVYRRFVADLRAVGVTVVADVTGTFLDACLESGLDILKVSDEELQADGRIPNLDESSVLGAIEQLRTNGARNVVVSRRESGLLVAYDDMLLRVTSPQLSVTDPRGAGDSLTAALAVTQARGLGATDSLRLATAAAAVNVTRHGLASGNREAIEQLASRVHIDRMG